MQEEDGNRSFILISVPSSFKDKFINLVRNVNSINSEKSNTIIIEWECDNQKYAAVPKKGAAIDKS